MKIVILIARLLLGLMFVFFGSNLVHPFLSMGALSPGLAGQFEGALFASHFMVVVGAVMVISGLLFLVNRFVALGLVLLGPILVNILLFHTLLQHEGFQPGLVATILWFVVFYGHRSSFEGIFRAKA
jgi:hypothetical protein